MSTRRFHTFSSATKQSDSKSTHPESLIARSRIRFSCTPTSDIRPASKWGAAIGPSSTLINSVPSFGRVARGVTTSQLTWASTRVSPSDTCTLPHSEPKFSRSLRNSSNERPSTRCKTDEAKKLLTPVVRDRQISSVVVVCSEEEEEVVVEEQQQETK
ncbi:hypothetical protein CpipJ_CPIJ009742 [Culex quinquefasciatus]|uniref:Uncharacterized protein n=1 Tax=Culex quinquefasciatus TaxID=7176 RepID=B0WS56_CULQU|nr:hypothetical protein CpipJ_CPIJ009742 [Culex quinquefasciatus]|eukprot:XP_001851540.1 hypothetical protein CpipJ_CPIJ009742 [Culex quinquefasciatus]